jgi:hypothetical protein
VSADEDPIIKALRAELAPIRAELAALCNPPHRSPRDLFRGHGVGAVTIGEVEALHHASTSCNVGSFRSMPDWRRSNA